MVLSHVSVSLSLPSLSKINTSILGRGLKNSIILIILLQFSQCVILLKSMCGSGARLLGSWLNTN